MADFVHFGVDGVAWIGKLVSHADAQNVEISILGVYFVKIGVTVDSVEVFLDGFPAVPVGVVGMFHEEGLGLPAAIDVMLMVVPEGIVATEIVGEHGESAEIILEGAEPMLEGAFVALAVVDLRGRDTSGAFHAVVRDCGVETFILRACRTEAIHDGQNAPDGFIAPKR